MEAKRRVYRCRRCGQPKKGHLCRTARSAADAEEGDAAETNAEIKVKVGTKDLAEDEAEEQATEETEQALPDYFVVLDLEATCDDNWNRNFYPQEIIEFSAVLVSSATHEEEDSFQVYVRPVVHPVLTPFCVQLTGIHQEWVDNGTSLKECLEMFHVWLERHDLLPSRPQVPQSFWLVTWSDWDLGTMLDGQCIRSGLDKEAYFGRWVDLKQLYMRYYAKKFRVKLSEAVASLGLSWEGEEHCALDDCRNTSRLLSKIIEHGHPVTITTTLPQGLSTSTS